MGRKRSPSLLRWAGPVFHLNWVAGLFADLKSQFPELLLDLKTEHRERMGVLLLSGALNVYLGIHSADEVDDSLFVKHVTQVEHGFVLRKDDPVSHDNTVNPTDLSGYQWVSFTSLNQHLELLTHRDSNASANPCV